MMDRRPPMRAARLHALGQNVRLEELPYPEPGPGEVVVRLAACGICGSDVPFLEGIMPVAAPLPMTLGHEPAGVVDTVGDGVIDWLPGDRVALHLSPGCGSCRPCLSGHPMSCHDMKAVGFHFDGGFADAACVPSGSLVRVPDEVSLVAAAVATACVATPYHALTCRGLLTAGESVAVIGVGGLGSMAVKLAAVLGAGEVVAVDRSPVALERAEALGATATVLVEAGDPTARIRSAVGDGADLVLECVGTADTVSIGVRSLVAGGRLVCVGVGMESPRIDLPQALFDMWELSVIGTMSSHPADLEEVLRLQAEGRIDIEEVVSHRFALEKVSDALEMLMTKRGDPQRIVIEIDPELV